ncbi:hypothetical protein L3049_03455 [Labilibaculum sp. DW002]|uniref:Lipocalin-like domain-containing protein n=1 Tax=Paralabilibaculum antarcticum TaxID=2912572 RepID=A0ABT5VNN0_9BACT|nr:hypothetical protein [Labilibaculum sp. DW002]MDE5417053.1 hypothetical protein [Labilibaculum sp. DW002]
MNSKEMMEIIMSGNWHNVDNNIVCSFNWADLDKSISIKYHSGDKEGQSDSHQFVKLYHTAEELANCTLLRYQSNLFTSEFRLESENGPLHIDSNVFGKLKLVRK